MENGYRLDFPNGTQFGTIYADPPWPLDQPNTKHKRRRIHFDRMNGDEIMAMGEKIKAVSHPDAHLWLWTTNAHLELALRVVHEWGFNYKSLVTWEKTKMGTGWWLRSKTEHLIFAAKTNNMRHNPGSFSTVLKGKWRGHSVKPDEAYPMIESLSPAPRLELFSRLPSPREGWTTLSSDRAAPDPFGQLEKYPDAMPDPGDGKVRGVGNLEIVEGEQYVRLEKKLIVVPVTALRQKNRRVEVLIHRRNGGEIYNERKWVTIDSLRAATYEIP